MSCLVVYSDNGGSLVTVNLERRSENITNKIYLSPQKQMNHWYWHKCLPERWDNIHLAQTKLYNTEDTLFHVTGVNPTGQNTLSPQS